MEWLVEPCTVRRWNVVVWKDDHILKRYHEEGKISSVASLAVLSYPWADKIWVGWGSSMWQKRNRVAWVVEK